MTSSVFSRGISSGPAKASHHCWRSKARTRVPVSLSRGSTARVGIVRHAKHPFSKAASQIGVRRVHFHGDDDVPGDREKPLKTPVDAAHKARRGLTLILGVTTFGLLALTSRVPADLTSGRTALGVPGLVVFPLVTSADHRYLQDQNGQPFPILGRASWSVVSLSVADYQTYLDDTAARGFNAIELNLIDRASRNLSRPFAGNGSAPFTKDLSGAAWSGSMSVDPDFTFPNETYWSFVDGLLTYARAKGILCFVFPSYVGLQGNDTEGWMNMMSNNGATKMTTYGAFVANRYKLYPNLVWMLGGDYGTAPSAFAPNQVAVEQAMLAGMQSVSGQASTSIGGLWAGDSIYTTQTDATLKAAGILQGAYTWGSVSQWCRNGYAATPAMPAFLLEGPYDEEGPDGTNVNPGATQPVRRFQWWSWLSSIGGYISGNGYVWMFTNGDWQAHLNTQATQDNTRLNAFIQSLAWYSLVPSGLGGVGTLVTAGGSTPSSTDYVAAAANPAGTLLVAYVPPAHTGTITLDMTAMSGAAQANWFNPTTAAYTLISPSIANTGTHTFTPPGDNGSGYSDWVLVLDASTANPTPTPPPTRTPTRTPTATPTLTPTASVTPAPARFFPLIPCRLVDTRRAPGPLGGPALDANQPRTFAIANVCNVPSTARAISVNVTAIGPATAGQYRFHAADRPLPISSTLSFAASRTRANNGVVALSGDGLGRFTVQPDLSSGTSHLVVDVNGYFQ